MSGNSYLVRRMIRILEDILEEEKRHTTQLQMNIDLIKQWMTQDKDYHDKTLEKLDGEKNVK